MHLAEMLRKLLDVQASAAKERLVNQKDKHGITPAFLTMQRCVVGGGEGMGFAYQGSSFFSYSRLPCCSLHRFSPCLFPHAAMLPCCLAGSKRGKRRSSTSFRVGDRSTRLCHCW